MIIFKQAVFSIAFAVLAVAVAEYVMWILDFCAWQPGWGGVSAGMLSVTRRASATSPLPLARRGRTLLPRG